MDISSFWNVFGCDRCPDICRRIVSSAGVEYSSFIVYSAPYNHLFFSPYCCMVFSYVRRFFSSNRCPSICRRIISPTSIQVNSFVTNSTPYNHLVSIPDCCMEYPCIRSFFFGDVYPFFFAITGF